MIAIAGFIICLIAVVIAISFVVERSYRVNHLKKQLASQNERIHNYENKREEFAIAMSEAIKDTKKDESDLDSVTHILGRKAFDKQFGNLISQSKRFNSLFAILMFDFNGFRDVNGSLSQQDKNKLLAEIAVRIIRTIREADIASHYENDTFIILLPNMIRPEVIVHAVERIMKEISKPFFIENKSLELNAHAGIAIYPFDGDDKIILLNNVRIALDKARNDGKNVFNFYQQETQALGERELNLKNAIRSEDFFKNVSLSYFPYFDTVQNKIAYINVHASYDHPEHGKIAFEDIVRVAQYSSKMIEFYEWMIKETLLKFELSTLDTLKPKRFIFTFNLRQFETKNFLENIIAVLKKYSSSENEIIMEITDNDIDATNLEIFKDAISRLNESKIPIAIGILVLGHFSINKLNHMPFSYLKIDEKLVKDIGKRSESIAILEKIMLLASNLNIQTLTTGVDVEEQKNILQNMGCSNMQGKLFEKRNTEEGFFLR